MALLLKQQAHKVTLERFTIIIVNTIYNPIPDQVFGLPLEISGTANSLIQSMNNEIIIVCGERGHLVSDIYSDIGNGLNMMNANVDLSALTLSFDVFHPNAAGHELIAQRNYDTYIQRIH